VSAFDPARLEAVSDRYQSDVRDALRAFAQVARVLGDKRLRVQAISPFGFRARIGSVEGTGSDPLAALLALAEVLAKEGK
jgi:hypothetical protein